MSKPSRLLLKLQAMSFPYALDPNSLDVTQFHKMVLWLEDTQIRLWSESERAALKVLEPFDQWWPQFAKYCGELGYKKPLPPPCVDAGVIKQDQNFRLVVDWLVGKAIRFFYSDEDGVETYSAGHKKYINSGKPPIVEQLQQQQQQQKPKPAPVEKKKDVPFRVDNPEAISSEVTQLCTALQLTPTGDVCP
eukprot:NODE_876_length_1270_cov_86.211302_g646_i0.p1 GENE.NODE_876_length_1270_cov_86.211302_g646_i0~~NODE_876_length_1270_cov_86.211302_g646_i0.p1  ORF type:complete len:210 (-),score=49.19 NODE_876_length_1270_cov_86.211302_g646_i0:639-1211(-)